MSLPTGLVVAAPCFFIFLVLARGWQMERWRAQNLRGMIARDDVRIRDLTAIIKDRDHQLQAARMERDQAVALLADAQAAQHRRVLTPMPSGYNMPGPGERRTILWCSEEPDGTVKPRLSVVWRPDPVRRQDGGSS